MRTHITKPNQIITQARIGLVRVIKQAGICKTIEANQKINHDKLCRRITPGRDLRSHQRHSLHWEACGHPKHRSQAQMQRRSEQPWKRHQRSRSNFPSTTACQPASSTMSTPTRSQQHEPTSRTKSLPPISPTGHSRNTTRSQPVSRHTLEIDIKAHLVVEFGIISKICSKIEL